MTDKLNELRFIEWNYETGEAIEYLREGECNQCGDCCTAMIRFEVHGRRFRKINMPEFGEILSWPDEGPGAKSGGECTDLRGVWYEIQRGGLRRLFKDTEIGAINSHVCEMLTEDRKCAVQGAKSLYNKAWPMNPRQVAAFSRCSYTFIEVNRWRID